MRVPRVGITAILLAVAIAACVVWWARREPVRDATPDTRIEALADPSLAPARPPDAPHAATGVTLDDADNDALTQVRRQQQRQQVSQVVEAGRRKIVGIYESETMDRQWAGSKQRTLESLQVNAQIQELNAQPSQFAAACRTSTCRIQADFPSQRASEDWVTLFLLNAGPEIINSSVNRITLPDGSVSIEIYSQAR